MEEEDAAARCHRRYPPPERRGEERGMDGRSVAAEGGEIEREREEGWRAGFYMGLGLGTAIRTIRS